jgi:hypothetical protein
MDMATTNTAMMSVENRDILQMNIIPERETNMEQDLTGMYTGCSKYSSTHSTVHDALKWAQ